MATHLSSGQVNLGLLRDAARHDMVDAFDKYEGTKAIVWDNSIIGPFGLLADFTFLKSYCGCAQMIPLRGGHLPVIKAENIVYIVRPDVYLMNIIADNITQEFNGNSRTTVKFHILFIPRKSLVCEKKLEDLNVLSHLTSIEEYSVELFPVDSDVLSMEMPFSFKDCIEYDYTPLYHAARSIMIIQAFFGIIPSVYGQGKAAKHVYDLMTRMRREMEGKEPQVSPQIDSLLLLDRSVDILSPLVTQLTYEGLLDEIYGINNNTIKLPPEKFAQKDDADKESTDPATQMKQFHLNSAEELFAEIRDKNFNAVGSILSKTAKALSAQFVEGKEAKSVSEMKEFVQKLPQFQATRKSLAKQTSIAELIKEVTDSEEFREKLEVEQEFLNGNNTDRINDYIESCIARMEPLTKVLRLLCIQSITNHGLKPKVLDYYKREIVQTYGFHHMFTLWELEKAGLLRPMSTSFVIKPYTILKKSLKLMIDKVDEQNPTDIAYVHSGYAPLSVRLAQYLAQPGWRTISEALKLLPEPTVEEVQRIPGGLKKRRSSSISTQAGQENPKVILVFFLGGCTYAEVSAFRFLSQKSDLNAKFIIATTKLINGNTFLEPFIADQKKI